MRQYAGAKQQNPDALLFFRLGDFYELFYEDARTAARELGITLTSRDRERGVPMCGVPFHAAEGHIAKLLRRGYRVAVCEQMEDPKQAKKIVRREVTRVLTPGTVADQQLGAGENNYLAALHVSSSNSSREPVVGLALLDLSTGEFRGSEWTGANAPLLAADALACSGASEILLPGSPLHVREQALERALALVRTKTTLDDWVFTLDYAAPLLERQLGARTLEGFGLAGHPAAAVAAGAVLHYAQNTQRSALAHIDSFRFTERDSALQLDAVSVRNLELVEPLFRSGGAEATLAHTLDCCRTPMGKRLLRATILRPLADPESMRARWGAVRELSRGLNAREALRPGVGCVLA